MAVFRFTILLSEDFNGFVTAQAVGERVSGFGQTKDIAIAQVKEYLQWFYERNWWRTPEEFGEAKMLEFRVDTRAEYKIEEAGFPEHQRRKSRHYQAKKRVFASENTLPLRIACIYREESAGSYFAALPSLDIEFYYYEPKELKNLVSAYVQEQLKGLTTLELARFLPPKKIWLEDITIQIRRSSFNQEYIKETPNLGQVAEPLGAKDFSRKVSKAYERENEVADVVDRLRNERANIILLGENGVGKTTILNEAVRKIENDLVNRKNFEEEDSYGDGEKMPRHRFWQTSGSRLIAGMMYLGQWQERCEEVIEELSDIEGILCVENLLDLIQSGGREPVNSLAAFFMPFLQRGELRMIAEATPTELDACRRLLPGFADLFQIVRLANFTPEKALSALNKIAAIQMQNSSIQLEQRATDLIYRLFSRFMPYQAFPGKTPAFLHELFERQKAKGKRQKTVENNLRGNLEPAVLITSEDVIENFVRLTGLPKLFLRDEIPLEFEDVVSQLEHEVIGQPGACRTVARAVTTFKAGLNDPTRPLAVLVFVGQTGVGKTELAKTLAQFFFGAGEKKQQDRLIRLDMSEYSLPGSASRLLTNAEGQPSDLIQKVRQQPFCVILFDEIEKADTAVFDVLLGLFDEGRLTDRFGRTTNFRSSLIILTSNLGADKFGGIGFKDFGEPSYEREVQAFFRPEFFNRIDAVVRFTQLDREALLKITERELQSIARREGLRAAGIELIWTQEVVEFLASKGFDPKYGARPLQRTIETRLTAPLAKFLLQQPVSRNSRLQTQLGKNEEIIFQLL